MMGKRLHNEFALDVFYCVTDEPRNNQLVEAAGECRFGHTYLPKATPHTTSRWLSLSKQPPATDWDHMVNEMLTEALVPRSEGAA